MKKTFSKSKNGFNYSANLLAFFTASLVLVAGNFFTATFVQAADQKPHQKQEDCCVDCETTDRAAASSQKSVKLIAQKSVPPPPQKTLAQRRDEKVTIKANTKPIELEGEVVDSWCYSSGVMGEGRGEKHRKCGRLCVGGGVTAGILTDDGTLYIAAKHQAYNGCAGLLLPYVADRVRVKGWLSERGGVKLLKILKVERVKTPAKTNTTRP